jgi:hypothetical protein
VATNQHIALYVSRRDSFAVRIADIGAQLVEWTEKHREQPPTLYDIAVFEGLRAERSRLLATFGDYEDRFVLQLLQDMSRD